MTNEEIAEQLVRNHKDFEAEGFSEYMNGYLNGIILGLEYAQGKVKNLSSNTVLADSGCDGCRYFNSCGIRIDYGNGGCDDKEL